MVEHASSHPRECRPATVHVRRREPFSASGYNVTTSDHIRERSMKRVGIREFRDHATRYLAGDEVLAVERHGRPVGFYIPTGASRQEQLTQALQRLEHSVRQVLTETGLSEAELSRLYDLSEPAPDHVGRRRNQAAADAHATGR